MSSAGGASTPSRFSNMLTNYGDFGAMQRIAYQVITGSTVTDFDFQNIPQTYQDLVVVVNARTTAAATSSAFYFTPIISNQPASPCSRTILSSDGVTASSSRNTGQDTIFAGTVPAASATSGIFGSIKIDILNYANTSTFKTCLFRTAADRNGSGDTTLGVGLVRGTNGVARINISTFSGSVYWAVGSTVELFGVKASNA